MLKPPPFDGATQADEFIRVWSVENGNGANFFVNAYLDSPEDYAQILLEISALIASEIAEAKRLSGEAVLARILDDAV